MSGWPGRSPEPAAWARRPARPGPGWIARSGTGAAAAVAVMLGSSFFAPASNAQIARAGSSRARGSGPAAAWAGFAGNAQHTAVASVRPQPLKRIRWRAKVDLAPVAAHKVLPIHYGSPMITAANTVLVPTRVSAKAGFRGPGQQRPGREDPPQRPQARGLHPHDHRPGRHRLRHQQRPPCTRSEARTPGTAHSSGAGRLGIDELADKVRDLFDGVDDAGELAARAVHRHVDRAPVALGEVS